MFGLAPPPMISAPTKKKRPALTKEPDPLPEIEISEAVLSSSSGSNSISDDELVEKKQCSTKTTTLSDEFSFVVPKPKPKKLARPPTQNAQNTDHRKQKRPSAVSSQQPQKKNKSRDFPYGSVTIARPPPKDNGPRPKYNGLPKPNFDDHKKSNPQSGKLAVGSLDLSRQARDLLPLLKRFSEGLHLELEAKVGKWDQSSRQFISGMSNQDFMRVHDMLASYHSWVNKDQVTSNQWVTTFDYMLDNNVRVTKSSAGNTFIKKTALEHVTFHCPDRNYDIRISLKEELPTQVRLPQEPRMVRVKKRKSFNYKNRWRFDLTVVWSGKDEQDAQSRPPSHEIECEFIASPHTVGPNYEYTATSLLEKMIDFLNRDLGPPLSLIKV